MRRAGRVASVVAALGLLAAACGGQGADPGGGGGSPTPTAEAARVGLVYDIGGRGDLSFNDAAARGLDRAEQELGIEVRELEPNQGGTNRGELLRLLAEQDTDLVIGVGFLFAEDICKTSLEFPDVNFADVDGFINKDTCEGAEDLTPESNVASLLFAEEQGSYLVGAAAALESQADHLGFIGGVEIELIKKFEAGFVAGARKINPDIEIDIAYITQPPDFSGFNDPAKGKEIAAGMYDAGADVVYHAAGGSGSGLFEAAKEASQGGEKRWAIGVDSDQYLSAPDDVKPFILTSMLKRVDVAVFETIQSLVEGDFEGGYQTFDLERDGVGYSTSGGFLDDITDQLEDLKQQIIAGEIEVPTTPES